MTNLEAGLSEMVRFAEMHALLIGSKYNLRESRTWRVNIKHFQSNRQAQTLLNILGTTAKAGHKGSQVSGSLG